MMAQITWSVRTNLRQAYWSRDLPGPITGDRGCLVAILGSQHQHLEARSYGGNNKPLINTTITHHIGHTGLAGQQKHSETNHPGPQLEKHIIHYTLYCSVLLEFMMVNRFREHQVFLVPVKHWWSLIMTRLADDRVKPLDLWYRLDNQVLWDFIWTLLLRIGSGESWNREIGTWTWSWAWQ